MIEEQLVDKLRANRKKVEELTRSMSVDLIDERSYEAGNITKLTASIAGCFGAIKGFFGRSQASDMQDSVESSVVLMNQGNVQDSLLMLNRLARNSNLQAQLKLAEYHCIGLVGVSDVGRNPDYGLKVLNMLLSKRVPEAYYTNGVYNKHLPNVPVATSNFEQSYNLGYVKAYTELVASYKRQLHSNVSAEERIQLMQKLNNIKSELAYE